MLTFIFWYLIIGLGFNLCRTCFYFLIPNVRSDFNWDIKNILDYVSTELIFGTFVWPLIVFIIIAALFNKELRNYLANKDIYEKKEK